MARELGASRPLVVTDRIEGSLSSAGALEALRRGGLEQFCFSASKAEPPGHVGEGSRLSGPKDMMLVVGGWRRQRA